MKHITLAVSILLLLCGASFAQVVSSDHAPKVERLQGAIIVPYDVREVEKDKARSWEYRELRIPDKGQPFSAADGIAAVKTETEKLTAADDAAALLARLAYKDIDAHVDATFAALSAGQRTSLKKLYKAVLYLLKEQQE